MGYEGLRAPWPWSIAPNFRNKPLICLYLHKQKSKVKGLVVHRLLAVAFPPEEEEEMGHPAAGREERRRRPMASRAARRGDHWYAVYLYPHPRFTPLLGGGGGGGGVCRVSCTLGVRRKSSTKKRKKKLLDCLCYAADCRSSWCKFPPSKTNKLSMRCDSIRFVFQMLLCVPSGQACSAQLVSLTYNYKNL